MKNNHPLAWGTLDGPKQDTNSWAYKMAREAERKQEKCPCCGKPKC